MGREVAEVVIHVRPYHAGDADHIGVSASEQGRTGRRADGRVGIEVVQSHPLGDQSVNVRRLHILCPIAGEIAIAEIIHEDQEDVGLFVLGVRFEFGIKA